MWTSNDERTKRGTYILFCFVFFPFQFRISRLAFFAVTESVGIRKARNAKESATTDGRRCFSADTTRNARKFIKRMLKLEVSYKLWYTYTTHALNKITCVYILLLIPDIADIVSCYRQETFCFLEINCTI